MKQAKVKRSHLGLMIIIGTLTILLFILIAAVSIYVLSKNFEIPTSDQPTMATKFDPRDALDIQNIDPALALASLGGIAEEEVIIEAIDKSRPETALAAILYQPMAKDQESAGNFLLLAATYTTVDQQHEKALLCYRLAAVIATLSPDIPDTVRADIFLQVGEGLLDLDESDWARFYLDQAFLIVSNSPFMQAAHRRTLFERLHQDYSALKESQLARLSLNLGTNPPNASLATTEKATFPQPEAVPLPTSAQEAEAERWILAQELSLQLVERGGRAPQETINALKEALLIEDKEKVPYYESELNTNRRVSRKIDFTLAKIKWLTMKYRIARQGYGLSIVPEWEAEVETIETDLSAAYETLFNLYAELIVALPEVSQINKATEEKIRSEILAGELDRYPNYPEQERHIQLLAATEKLINTQPELKIFVGVGQVADQEIYRLMTPDEVQSIVD